MTQHPETETTLSRFASMVLRVAELRVEWSKNPSGELLHASNVALKDACDAAIAIEQRALDAEARVAVFDERLLASQRQTDAADGECNRLRAQLSAPVPEVDENLNAILLALENSAFEYGENIDGNTSYEGLRAARDNVRAAVAALARGRAEAEAALAAEKDEHSMTWECLHMVAERLSAHGCRHSTERDYHTGTPPMMYPEYINCVVDHAKATVRAESDRTVAELRERVGELEAKQ